MSPRIQKKDWLKDTCKSMQMEVWITKRGFIYQIILERMHAMHILDQYTRTS